MVICRYFMQGSCRFGQRCWNEHPKGGRQQSGYQQHAAGPPPGNFSYQNRYSTLHQQDYSRDTQSDKDGSLLDETKLDLDSWESSGQWIFSVYYSIKVNQNITGFSDISPEELRLEYYTAQSAGKLNDYVNSVQQLASRWKKRINDIRNMNPSSQAALINELTKTAAGPAPTFGGQPTSGFGTSGPSIKNTAPSAVNFSFKPDSQNAAPMAGSFPSFPVAPAFGNQPTAAFINPVTGPAASFSFVAPTASGFGSAKSTSAESFSFAPTKPSGFGVPNSSDFSPAATSQLISPSPTMLSLPASGGQTVPSDFGNTTSVATGFGSVSSNFGFGAKRTDVSDLFKTAPAPSVARTSFGQPSGAIVTNAPSATELSSTTIDGNKNPLYTPRSELSAEERLQFEARKFTLGKVPLLPPPIDLLNVK